jgi:hypothetical protein
MKDLSCEFKKMDSYSGIEYGQRIIELYKEFPDERQQIDEYIKNRVYAVTASADEVIAKGVRYQLGEIANIQSIVEADAAKN